MKFITLSQKCTIWQPANTITGGEDKIIYEPVHVNSERIETIYFAGLTVLKMVSGERIEVTESFEEIQAMIESGNRLCDEVDIPDELMEVGE